MVSRPGTICPPGVLGRNAQSHRSFHFSTQAGTNLRSIGVRTHFLLCLTTTTSYPCSSAAPFIKIFRALSTLTVGSAL
ncbi:hypothetical protein PISMIDRAFT_675713 [Pisolithus microcarpus 441]|uniref:Uncharacterized protein n=1 Tax=Pisolithus microcarpus 441 TaxID=765257 RepID=A0A0C9ZLG7_9AGAM|nr:hypothetical protein PISMIDRAFT_675713 [Pisolithus microcarpus 441]